MDILPAILQVTPPLTLSVIGSVLTFGLVYLALTALRSLIDTRAATNNERREHPRRP
jgi:hypothetical protein